MRTSTRLLVGLAAAGAVAAGGSAFTASVDFTPTPADNVAGYGELNVSGATVSTIKHNLSTNGQTIVSTNITFSPAVKNGDVVRAGFNGGTQVTCTLSAGTYTCTYGAGAPTTSTATNFTVSVS